MHLLQSHSSIHSPQLVCPSVQLTFHLQKHQSMEDLVSGSSTTVRSVLSSSEGGQAQPEESSWTDYFVDFMMSEEEEEEEKLDVSYCNTYDGDNYGDCSDQKEEEEGEEDSMISDAASRAPAALPDRYKELKELKKLKKKVFKALDHDDSLEDTASSPVNSPKVSALSQLELSPKRRCNACRDLTKYVEIGDNHGRDGMDDHGDEMVEGVKFVDQGQKSITPCAELKDNGLCLFPLSMLLHYHG